MLAISPQKGVMPGAESCRRPAHPDPRHRPVPGCAVTPQDPRAKPRRLGVAAVGPADGPSLMRAPVASPRPHGSCISAAPTRKNGALAVGPDPDVDTKPQFRRDIRAQAPGHRQMRDLTAPLTHAPARRAAVPLRPDGAGLSGSCPAGQERPDFRSLDAPDRDLAFTTVWPFYLPSLNGSPAAHAVPAGALPRR